MLKNMVYLKELKIERLKNTTNGVVSFNDEQMLEVGGVYGQTGSGKTTIVDAFSIIKTL